MLIKDNILKESYSILEIKTVLTPPIKLNFLDDVNCPICDIEIDVKGKIINNQSFVRCKDCNHKISFKIVQC
jgi:DNA-directed RNA polymerase subunit RPC12/RpoP